VERYLDLFCQAGAVVQHGLTSSPAPVRAVLLFALRNYIFVLNTVFSCYVFELFRSLSGKTSEIFVLSLILDDFHQNRCDLLRF